MTTIKEKIATLPSIILNERQLFDLEMILNKGFAPLKGFLKQDDYESVLEKSRLIDGSIWPIPITLDIDNNASKFKEGEEVILRDEFNSPIALLDIESVYIPDKNKEVLAVYGTDDETHPGVTYILSKTKDTYIGGQVTEIPHTRHFDFQDIRLSPDELKQKLKKEGHEKVVAFQTRNPIHRAHYELVKKAAKNIGGHALIHPVVGPTKEGDIDYVSRVQSYKALVNAINSNNSDEITLSLLPLAMRMAGPREALWHALIRKNYGATHFIVGRDHAGPGKDKSGKPFYGPYEAQEYIKKFAHEIGIEIITFQEQVYHQIKKEYIDADQITEGDAKAGNILSISGTEFRKKLSENEEIPEWFSFPEVIDALRNTIQKKGKVILFTGLSGVGKSTIAKSLKGYIETEIGKPVTFLDGDVVRKHLTEGLGFSKEDRIKNVLRVGFVAAEIAKHGGVVLVSLVSPYAEARNGFRAIVEPYAEYVEVYVTAPMSKLKERDTKGYYLKSDLGLMNNLTGVHDVYEEPERPSLKIDTSLTSVPDAVSQVILLFPAL